MPSLTLFEHERRSFAWTEREAALLDRVNRVAGVTVLEAGRYGGERVLKATEQVGVIRFGRHTVQVLPKISYGRDETASATRNLLRMLETAGDFPIREQEAAPLLQQGQDWFEILTRLFASHLMEEWQRGPYSYYQEVERTQPALKGRWRVTEQLRRPGREHLFDVSYDEFTADNPLNRVFRYVVEALRRLTRDPANRRLLGELRQWLEPVRLLPDLTADDASPVLISRLNRRFEPLLNLARLFLSGRTLQLATGTEQAFAFVFDMNALFEAYVIGLIGRYRASILPAAFVTSRLYPQGKGHVRYLAQTKRGSGLFRLKPDLVVRQDKEFPLLIDTKYKPLKPADARLGISQADFYQMFAYAHRYQCPRVLLLYPKYETTLYARFPLMDEPEKVIVAATVNLHRDLGSARERHRLVEEVRRIVHNVLEN